MFGFMAGYRRMAAIFVMFAMSFCLCNAQPAIDEPLSVGQKKEYRILAVGNSFSMDAVEQNLHELASAAGYSCEIGNLYIGGCSLERHVSNAENDAKAYEYRKVNFKGEHTVRNETSIREALCDGEWDFVSVQQVSQLSGLYETYAESLPVLLDYIKKYCPTAEIVLHQTWAYSENSTHEGFLNYGREQETMYSAIVSASQRAVSEFGIGRVIPSGTAIQNMRATSVGDNLNRDGFHLNELGRFTAACTWFEAIFECDVRDNGYENRSLGACEQRLAKLASHAAVENPYSVTTVTE